MLNRRMVVWLELVQVMSLSLWWGGSLFFSFIAAPRIFAYLQDQLPAAAPPGVTGISADIGRRLAGDTVGGIFPAYFAVQVIAGLAAVLTAVGLVRAGQWRSFTRCAVTTVALALVTTHALTIYPVSTRILDEHYQAVAAGEPGRAAELRKSFGAWHGVSQTLNLATILTVTGALVLAAWRPGTPPD